MIMCECNSFDCTRMLDVPDADYWKLHKDGKVFVTPGHEDAGDVIIEHNDTYLVVVDS